MSRPIQKTCKNGHEMTEANTYQRPDGRGNMCIQCRDDRKTRARNIRLGESAKLLVAKHWPAGRQWMELRRVRAQPGPEWITVPDPVSGSQPVWALFEIEEYREPVSVAYPQADVEPMPSWYLEQELAAGRNDIEAQTAWDNEWNGS